MSNEEQSGTAPTAVSIFGRTYYLRGDGDPAYLAELAADLDGKMREVAEASGTADTLKVAILAALNIADECRQSRRHAGIPENAAARLKSLVAELDEVIAG